MKKKQSPLSQEKPETVTLTADQYERMEDIISAISELSALSEGTDDQPSTILKLIANKALDLSEEVHLQRIKEVK